MKAKFGRYVFLKKLAVGGMAEIFLARRLSFGGFAKFVVLKRLLPEHRGKRAYEQLFLTEARLHAVLNHPHIVSLHDLGKLDDAYFMAMEYVHGVSGAELMARAAQRRKPLPMGCTLRIVIAMAEALHYGHVALDDLGEDALAILHHDVSPHNIQIGYDGAVKLLDYGVATREGHPAPGGRRGKPAYMSPEAISKDALDQRSDLFSLAIVLYEMTLSRRLFKAGTAKETMARAKAALVKPPHEIDPDYPRDLETVVLKALSRDRGRRYDTGQAFATALKTVAEAHEFDLTQEAFAAYLTDLYGDEITRRQLELATLARASAENRQARSRAAAEQALAEQAPPAAEPAPPLEPELEPDVDASIDGSIDESDTSGAGGEADPPADDTLTERPGPPGPDTLDAIPADPGEDMPTVVKAPSSFPMPEEPVTPAPVADVGHTPTPTPIPLPSTEDALEMAGEKSPANGEYDGEDALAYELPEAAQDQRPDWDEGTYAPPPAPRRGLSLVAVVGILVAVGAFFVGQRWPTLFAPSGRVIIVSDPAGATVESGGEAIGVTPLKIENLRVGDTLKLRVSKDGFPAVENEVVIDADAPSQKWVVTLQPR